MDIKIISEKGYIKGATADLLVSDILLISVALRNFAENEDRNLQDRARAERMVKEINYAIGTERRQNFCPNCGAEMTGNEI